MVITNERRGVMRFSILISSLLILMVSAVHAEDLILKNDAGYGQVISTDGSMVPIAKTNKIAVGESMMVGGSKGVTIATQDGIIEITAESKSVVTNKGKDSSGKMHITVKKGAVHFSVVPGNKLDVKTPHMVASVRGTEFSTEVGAVGTDLSVTEGAVEATDDTGQRDMVKAGSSLKAGAKGFDQESRSQNSQKNKSQSKAKASKANKGNSGNSGGNGGGNSGGNSGNGGGNGGGNGKGNSGGNGKGKGKSKASFTPQVPLSTYAEVNLNAGV